MVSRDDVERLRREADTIMTRIDRVQAALERARSSEGDHWETGELRLDLETPHGASIEVTVDLETPAAESAAERYRRAEELAAELDRRAAVADELDPMPADPLAYLVCYHLDTVEGNYPRSMAGHLDAERDHVEELCERMEATGLLERVESGTVKQRRVKAKMSDEVRQHHTYYRLSREGDHLLRFLAEREGMANALQHLPDGVAVARRLTDGPDSPRATAADLDPSFETVRHHYRALRRLGIVTLADGGGGASADDGNHTWYALTQVGVELLAEVVE